MPQNSAGFFVLRERRPDETDDTARLQEAIDECDRFGGGTVSITSTNLPLALAASLDVPPDVLIETKTVN